MLLHDPATAVLLIDFHLAVFTADLLFSKELVVLVIDLDVGVAVGVIHEGVHIVTADSVGDEVHLVALLDILSHHDDIRHMVVIPVAVAVQPEARPVVRTRGEWIPVKGMAVNHAVMMGVPEVGSGVHRTMRGRYHAARVVGAGIAVCRGRSHTAGTTRGLCSTATAGSGCCAAVNVAAYCAAGTPRTCGHRARPAADLACHIT